MKCAARRWIADFSQAPADGILSVLGPTGVGKTSGTLRLVRERWPTNLRHPLLVSVDAVAVYRGFDIGSAKPLGDEREPYDWAGLDFADPRARVSAADFMEAVAPAIRAARERARPVFLVGGSHFYERALVDGMSAGEPSDRTWLAQFASEPNEVLKRRLTERDLRWEGKVHLNDRYRLERYSDLALRQALSFDDLFGGASAESHRGLLETDGEVACLALGLDVSPDLHARVLRERIRAMLRAGWLEEVEGLLGRGLPGDAPAMQSVGYREIAAWIARSRPTGLETLAEEILTSHLQLAKKQRTWIRGLLRRSI